MLHGPPASSRANLSEVGNASHASQPTLCGWSRGFLWRSTRLRGSEVPPRGIRGGRDHRKSANTGETAAADPQRSSRLSPAFAALLSFRRQLAISGRTVQVGFPERFPDPLRPNCGPAHRVHAGGCARQGRAYAIPHARMPIGTLGYPRITLATPTGALCSRTSSRLRARTVVPVFRIIRSMGISLSQALPTLAPHGWRRLTDNRTAIALRSPASDVAHAMLAMFAVPTS
jgi:hypothetical protein